MNFVLLLLLVLMPGNRTNEATGLTAPSSRITRSSSVSAPSNPVPLGACPAPLPVPDVVESSDDVESSDEEPDEYDRGMHEEDSESDSENENKDKDYDDDPALIGDQAEEMDLDDEGLGAQGMSSADAEKKRNISAVRRAARRNGIAKQERVRKKARLTKRDSGRFDGPKHLKLRKRDKQKEVKNYDRQRKRQSRQEKKKARLDFLKRACTVLERAVNLADIKPIIYTDVDKFQAAGFASKISDFGSSTLLTYRMRAVALYTWHRHVLAHDGMSYQRGYVVAAQACRRHPDTIRKWVRSFHHLEFKIARLVVGLNKKTKSYLDDPDLTRSVVRYIKTQISAEHRRKYSRAVARRKKELMRHVSTFSQQAAKSQQESQQTTQDTQSSPHIDTHAPSSEVNLDLCICGQAGDDTDENMIMCGECERWHHPRCAGLTDRDFRQYKRAEEYPWFCPPCLEKMEREYKEEEEGVGVVGVDAFGPIPSDGKPEPEIYAQLTGARLLKWVNGVLLKPIIDQGGKPICEATAKAWLRKLGFRYRKKKAVVYMDGHERKDVVKFRDEEFLPAIAKFQKRMCTFEGQDCLTIVQPVLRPGEKELVLVVHDECAVACKDGTVSAWMSLNSPTPLPKSKGSCMMVSDFLSEMTGRLRLTEDQWSKLVQEDPDMCTDLRAAFIGMNSEDPLAHMEIPRARVLLETGKSRDGYWTGKDLIDQVMKLAIKMFELTHPGKQGLFLFHNSKCHGIMAPDSLNSKDVRLNPAGKQPKMRKGWYMNNGGVRVEQSMVFEETDILEFSFKTTIDDQKYTFKKGDAVKGTPLVGEAKGMRRVLWERGLWTEGLKAECVKQKRKEGEEENEEEHEVVKHAAQGAEDHGQCCATMLISQQHDFQEQKCWLEEIIKARGHEIIFLPKFHPELNFIERYWGRIKKWLRYHCDETWASLRITLVSALDNEEWCGLSLLRKYARVCWRYMDAYRKGYTGALAAYAVKKYKSHRAVCEGLDKYIDAAAVDGFLNVELEAFQDVAHVARGVEEDEEGAGGGKEAP